MCAVGLDLADLFPPVQPGQFPKRVARAFSSSDVLALVAFESSVAVVVCSDVLRDKAVTEGDYARLLMAAQRLADAAEVCHVCR